MPDGGLQTESYDGALRIVNVSREMTGTYRCATSQYNGFNVKPREALVELTVQCEYSGCTVFLQYTSEKCNWFEPRSVYVGAVTQIGLCEPDGAHRAV
jgi:hypothetical protein